MSLTTQKQHLALALTEIGAIEPWWSEDDQMFVFEHEAYPWVMHADPDRQATIDGYMRALRGFIKDRLAGKLAESAERTTCGRGGARAGAGRPRVVHPATLAIRLPYDIATWLKDNPENVERIKQLMNEAS